MVRHLGRTARRNFEGLRRASTSSGTRISWRELPEICQDHPDVLYELGEKALEERLRYFLDHPERRRVVASQLQQMAAAYRPQAVVTKIAAALIDVLPR